MSRRVPPIGVGLVYGSRVTDTPTSTEPIPPLLAAAWHAYGDERPIVRAENISATVSTNTVYRVTLSDKKQIIAKTSSYGSYVHFRQDHDRIHDWTRLLSGSRFGNFLAPVLTLDGKAFTFRDETGWVAFYGKTEFYDFLPKVLTEGQIDSFGAELASFHLQCQKICHRLPPTWKSMGSDIAQLFDSLSDPRYCAERHLRSEDASMLKAHCDRFLHNAEDLGYHGFEKLPVLVDWNTGNFSVGLDGDGFKLFTRWDYDWFRIEPRTLDFYFASRVVRSEGDQTIFSYLVDPLLEPRFIRFMRAYDAINPLADEEILFLKEVYRFFILNYVIREGEHFFQGPICQRLQREAVEVYLPTLDAVRFEKVIDALGHGGA